MPALSPPRWLRPFLLGFVLWAFGIATSLMLVSLWGRSVTADSSTMARAAREAAGAGALAVAGAVRRTKHRTGVAAGGPPLAGGGGSR